MLHYSFLQEAKKAPMLKSAKKVATAAIGAKALSISVVSAIVTKRLISLRKAIKNCETREEAERVLLNIGYIWNNEGKKEVALVSINYAVSEAVVGPSLQIVKNEMDPLWKEHVLNYIKLVATMKGIKSIIGAIAAAGSVKILTGK